MKTKNIPGAMTRRVFSAAVLATLAGCGDTAPSGVIATTPIPTPTPTPTPTPNVPLGVSPTAMATFAAPWTIAFLPTGEMLIGERTLGGGTMHFGSAGGTSFVPLSGLPTPSNGLLDIALDPGFGFNRRIFFSFIEIDPSAPRIGRPQDAPNEQPECLSVASATLPRNPAVDNRLTDVRIVWRQLPKITTPEYSGNFGGKLAFSPDGRYLFIANGDRQELVPDLIESKATAIGKIVRIYPDGSIPLDNPFVGVPGALPEIWTMGHRNPYGLAFDAAGQLWENENGPKGGDEINLLVPGKHYGWPLVSNGNQYDDTPITHHTPGDGYEPPKLSWTPSIAPSDMIFYSGSLFSSWRGDALVTGLTSKTLFRVRFSGTSATEVQRIDMGARLRALAEAPDGSIWVLEDKPSGRLLRLAPVPL